MTPTTLVCYSWLSAEERMMWVQILAICMPIGTMVSFIEGGLVFTANGNYKIETQVVLMIQSICITFFGLGFVAFLRDKPEFPPSAEANVQADKINLRETFGKLFSNRGFIIICLIQALMYGSFTAMASVLSLIFTPFNLTTDNPYSPGIIGMYGSLTVLAGVMCSLFTAIVMKRIKSLVLPMQVFIVLCGCM
jgi:hypothetical protein